MDAQIHPKRPFCFNLDNIKMVVRKVLFLIEFLPRAAALMEARLLQLLLTYPQQISLVQGGAVLEERLKDSPRLSKESSGGTACLTAIFGMFWRREHVADLSLQQHIQPVTQALISLQMEETAARNVPMEVDEILTKLAAEQLRHSLVLPHRSLIFKTVDEIFDLWVFEFGYASLQHQFHYSISPNSQIWRVEQKMNT